jgi:hypothetical protein
VKLFTSDKCHILDSLIFGNVTVQIAGHYFTGPFLHELLFSGAFALFGRDLFGLSVLLVTQLVILARVVLAWGAFGGGRPWG